MPDPVNPQATPPPAAPAPTPQPPPSQSPASPAPSPAPKPPASDTADPNQIFEYTGPDGSTRLRTLAQLVDADRNHQNINPEDVAQLELFRKARDGDKAAQMQLLGLGTAAAPPPPAPGSPDELVRQLQARLDAVEGRVATVAPTVEQINTMREVQALSSIVTEHSAQVPFLAKNPNAGSMVRDELRALHAKITQDGYKPESLTPDQHQKLIAHAIITAEQKIQAFLSPYGLTAPSPAPVAPPAPAGAANDQRSPAPGRIPARYQFVNGQMVDMSGQPAAQTAHGTIGTIPTSVPDASVAGLGVPTSPNPALRGKMTREQLIESLRGRVDEMRGNPNG